MRNISPKNVLVAATLLLAGVFNGAVRAADTLGAIIRQNDINIDKHQISVSGVSAGAWLANQFHIAHSAKIAGSRHACRRTVPLRRNVQSPLRLDLVRMVRA